MDRELDKAVLASLPGDRLDVLAGLRRESGITVAVRCDRAWVAWDPSRTNVARELLSVEHVEFFRVREGRYHRLGSWLPSSDVPRDLETTAVPLARALVPEPARLSTPSAVSIRPMPLTLVPDEPPRSATAMLCDLTALVAWADRATRSEVESSMAALSAQTALLVGRSLPWLRGATRLWGERVLVPLGLRPEPELKESAWAGVFCLDETDLAIVSAGGEVEVVPGDAVERLTRARVRMALGGRPS
jgi:hypothetical protein